MMKSRWPALRKQSQRRRTALSAARCEEYVEGEPGADAVCRQPIVEVELSLDFSSKVKHLFLANVPTTKIKTNPYKIRINEK